MSHGYSQSLVKANKEASARSLGVALGRVCIKAGVSVIDVASWFGVTRMTVYNWFKGVSAPNPLLAKHIEDYIQKTKARYNLR